MHVNNIINIIKKYKCVTVTIITTIIISANDVMLRLASQAPGNSYLYLTTLYLYIKMLTGIFFSFHPKGLFILQVNLLHFHTF